VLWGITVPGPYFKHCAALMPCWDTTLNYIVKFSLHCPQLHHCVLHPCGPQILYSLFIRPLRISVEINDKYLVPESSLGWTQVSSCSLDLSLSLSLSYTHTHILILSKESRDPEGLLALKES